MKHAATLLFCGLLGTPCALAGEVTSSHSSTDVSQAPPFGIELPDDLVTDQVFDESISPAGNDCTPKFRERVLESVFDEQERIRSDVEPEVEIRCDLVLQPGDEVTKRLILTGPKASGTMIDCNGATINGKHWMTPSDRRRDTILVRGEQDDTSGVWHGAENITIRDCIVHGSVRVYGIATSLKRLKQMSHEENYTEILQEAGSKNIVFDNLHIFAYGRNPFYVAAGVTRVTLMNSTIRGHSDAVAIYLNHESAGNIIKDNDIGVINDDEQIALDGSARNLIVGNRISGLNHGGIYLYRNCGEHGIIRHQGAADNVIIDNRFYYKHFPGDTPAVWIASRQNNLPCDWWDGLLWADDCYCKDDEGPEAPDIGSSLDHLDHAYRNVVAYNRFIAREPDELIRVHGDPSYVFGNVRVSDASDRNSPCYVANGYPSAIIEHGESVALFDDGEGPRCTGRQLTCEDGLLRERAIPCLQLLRRVSIVPFECRAEDRNDGCAGRAACPDGTSLASVKAACNLEFGEVSAGQLAATPWSLAGVVKRSDDRADGVCRLASIDVSENGAELGALSSAFSFSCREHDRNDGDCHVRGAVACQGSLTGPVQAPTKVR